uniref:receptor protein-tyrosine kinase n=1 Tax=Leptobrachium leishanense TaxID=445787 RepID=A0A8C5MBC5_9ANUR
MEIPLRSLTEILNGGVQIYSSHLCNLHTIQWEDIVNTERFRISVSEIEDTNFDCSSCDVNCNGSCWAPGPENCQRFTKRDCSIMCSHGCRGPTSSDCCDEQCASGCTGSQPKDCLACRTLNDGETCRESCPASTIYNTDKFKTEPNANAMHHIHDYCFRECPDSYKRLETGECVSECSPDSEEIEENGIHVCRKRIGKACDGIGTGVLANAVSIRSTNIDLFQNCTKILGNLIFLPQDKYSEPSALLDPMKYNIFKTIQEITGYLLIKWWPGQYLDLSPFENLEIIHGKEKKNGKYSLILINLSVTSLGLRSLKHIKDGDVLIKANRNLCYVDSLKWSRFVHDPSQTVSLEDNQIAEKCALKGYGCDPLCSDEGCWGPGPFQCLSCRRLSRGRKCVQFCNLYDLSEPEYASNGKCNSCHVECKPQVASLTCTGPDSDQCAECAHYKDGPYCVKSCPSGLPDKNDNVIWKYPDTKGLCQLCDPDCAYGCKGPGVRNCSLAADSVGNAEENNMKESPPSRYLI